MATNETAAPQQFITLTMEQFREIVAGAAGGNSDDVMRKQAQFYAEANKRAMRPENEQAPEVSVYNPEGETAHPKIPLRCKMFSNGYPLELDQLTPEEASLLNRFTRVGEFPFQRTDKSPDILTVVGERNGNGQFERMQFNFRHHTDSDRATLPSFPDILRSALGDVDEATRLRKELEALKAKMAGATP